MTKFSHAFRKKRGVPSFPKVKTMYRRGMENLIQRLLVIFLGLVIYRVGVFIPVPGISAEACAEYFKEISLSGNFLSNLNRFFGGTWERASIFSVGIQPYITASILMRFFTLTFPKLKEMQNESGAGREKVNQYMRYLTILIALVHAFSGVFVLSGGRIANFGGWDPQKLLTMDGNGFQIYFVMVTAFVGGSAFLMWLCEQMTEYGIGNGTSFIIFAGVVSNLPAALSRTIEGLRQGSLSALSVSSFVLCLLTVLYFMTFFELSYRKVPIQYAQGKEFQKRLVPMPESCLPLKFNIAEIMPAMVCVALMQALTMGVRFLFPYVSEWSFAQFVRSLVAMDPTGGVSLKKIFFLEGPLLIFSCFIYSGINFDCWESADHLKKDKAGIPGIRPGIRTALYLKALVDRITRLSALYILFVVCGLRYLGFKIWGNTFTLGGTQTLIVIGVVVELLEHISTHIASHQYENLLARTQFWRLRQR